VTDDTLAFMNVLEDPIALANLGSGERVDRVAQIRHNRFAHLLLLCAMDVILNSPGCCWENANGDCLASWVYALPFTRYLFPVNKNKKLVLKGTVVPDCPWRNALQLELRNFSNAKVFSSVEGDNRGRLCDVYPD
jgi:hypothetical protein